MPKLYNYRTDKDIPESAIRIDRTSPYGNPFHMFGDSQRDLVCDKFEATVEADPVRKAVIIKALRGKDLVCWCAPKRCHGDYLLRISNQ